MSTGWRPAMTRSYSVDYAAPPGESRTEAVRAALREAFAPARGRRAACSVVLSNTYARFALLPWRDELGHSARMAYARAHLVNTYGAAATAWELVLDDSGYGFPTAVCAIDAALLAAIRDATVEAGLGLTTIQPYFSAAFNHCRARMTELEHWFAVAEPSRLCLARVAHGTLTFLQAQRVTRSLGVELASMLEREALVHGSETAGQPVYVFAPEVPAAALTAPAGVNALQFDPQRYLATVRGDARYALALALA